MAGVIVQSRATAHVYRVFGALVALLLLMALAVGVLRFRGGDHPAGSPYGVLGAVAPTTTAPVVVAARAPGAASASPLPPTPVVPVVTTAASDGAATASGAMSAARAPALAAPAPTDGTRVQPRQIAIDKAAAGSVVSQPAPIAAVQAATRAAATPPAPSPQPPAARVAALTPAAASPLVQETAADAVTPPVASPQSDAPQASASGLVNINTASVDQLNAVGAGHVGRTIARHRPYRSLQDLVDQRVLNARDFARIRAAITVD